MLSGSHIQGSLEDVCMTTERLLLMFSVRYASRMRNKGVAFYYYKTVSTLHSKVVFTIMLRDFGQRYFYPFNQLQQVFAPSLQYSPSNYLHPSSHLSSSQHPPCAMVTNTDVSWLPTPLFLILVLISTMIIGLFSCY